MAGGGCTLGLLEHSSKPFSSSRAFSCFTCLKSDSLFPETANTSSGSGPGTLSMLGAQPSSSSRSLPRAPDPKPSATATSCLAVASRKIPGALTHGAEIPVKTPGSQLPLG